MISRKVLAFCIGRFLFPTDPRSIVLWQTDFSGWTFQRHFQHNESGIRHSPDPYLSMRSSYCSSMNTHSTQQGFGQLIRPIVLSCVSCSLDSITKKKTGTNKCPYLCYISLLLLMQVNFFLALFYQDKPYYEIKLIIFLHFQN